MHLQDRSAPAWPVPLTGYDYTRFLSRSRWAWEFVRRNASYVRDWRVGRIGAAPPIRLTSSARMTRLRRRFRRAEDWGLCHFR